MGHGCERLRSCARPKIELFNTNQGHGFVPAGHKMLSVNPVEAKAPLVIVESPDRKHVAALGFERAYTIYGDAKGNGNLPRRPLFWASQKDPRGTIRSGEALYH